ncbi:MAG: ABC transporter substrate-binding protein [Armatimonadota bacterium]|nr:ABC transporter substrate-binding protein [Armatimonadota bacterium]
MGEGGRARRIVRGQIDRRTFLKSAGVTLLALSQLDRIALAAPGGPPKRGGVLVVGADVSPPGLDPQKSAAAHSWMISEHIYSNLLRRSPTMKIVPDLAESYEIVNPTTYTFKLRRGVTWHHGREVVADDVKYSFERMMDARTASPWRSIWLIIERIDVPDRYTVRFTTRRPFAPFFSYLATPHYSSIVPRDVVEKSGDLQQTASGTGPFVLERFVPENIVVLKRNPNYFESGLPYLDGIEYRIIPDEAARLAALRTGSIHYMWSADPLVDEQVKGMPGVAILEPKGYCGQHGLAFNQTKPPFDDVRVRRAVSVSLNRREIIRVVLRGKGGISTKIPPCDAPFGYSGDERGLPYYEHNPALARQLLSEAGYPRGLDTTLEVPPRFPQTVRTGEVMREQLAAAGIRVTLKQMEWGAALTNYIRTTYDGMSMIPLVWQPDPDAHVYDIYHSDSAINLGKFRDPFVDQLLDLGRTTLDREKRVAIYQQLQRYFADQAYMIYPYASGAVELLRDFVKGYVSIPGAQPPSRSRQFFKQVWLDK